MSETAAAMTDAGFLAKGPAAQEKPTTFLRRLLKKPLAVVSIAWLVLVLAIALLAPWVSPFDPLGQDLLAVLCHLSWRRSRALGAVRQLI